MIGNLSNKLVQYREKLEATIDPEIRQQLYSEMKSIEGAIYVESIR